MTETTERVSFQSLMAKAYSLGQDHGEAAAGWYWDDATTSIDDYRRVHKGIEEGDSEIMDSLPHADLSGEMADGMTPRRLYEEVGVPDNLTDGLTDWLLTDLCEAYESGFTIAVESAVRHSCEQNLERNVRIELDCEASCSEEDLRYLIKDLEEQIGKHNGISNNVIVVDLDTEDDITPDM